MNAEKIKLLRQIIELNDPTTLKHESSEHAMQAAIIIIRHDPHNELSDDEISEAANKIAGESISHGINAYEMNEKDVIDMAYLIVNKQINYDEELTDALIRSREMD